MKKGIKIICCLLLLGACQAKPNEETTNQATTQVVEPFVEIDGKTVEQLFSEQKSFVLYVYGENCSYCQKFSPILTTVLQSKNLQAKKIVVDTNDENFQVVNSYVEKGLEGWPAIYVVDDGKIIDESVGAIEEEALVDFVEKNSIYFK